MITSYKNYRIGDTVEVSTRNGKLIYIVCGFSVRYSKRMPARRYWIDVAHPDNPTVEVNGYGEEIVTFISRPTQLEDELFTL